MWSKKAAERTRKVASHRLMWGEPNLRQAQGRQSAVLPGEARLLTILFLIAAISIPISGAGQKSSVAKPSEDLPAGAMQAKATTACLECHEARIILQQRLSKAAWTKEVDKMVKWGAVVDPADRDALIDYLSFNFSPEKPAYEPPRTAPERSTTEKNVGKATK